MSSPIAAITDKVSQMIKSMVYLAMRVSYRRGATVAELTGFLEDWTPAAADANQAGVIERVLEDLYHEGKVSSAGGRWYPVGVA
jgi:hypothetical protein